MEPEVIFSEFPYERAAFFQCIGGDNPVHNVYYNMARWIAAEGLDYRSRLIAGFDEPNQGWAPPPHGCVGLYFVEESEVSGGTFRGVHIARYNTHGTYATVSAPCHISHAWNLMFALRDGGEWAWDTGSGRQHFEQHIFGDDAFTHDERLSFRVWMPVRKA